MIEQINFNPIQWLCYNELLSKNLLHIVDLDGNEHAASE